LQLMKSTFPARIVGTTREPVAVLGEESALSRRITTACLGRQFQNEPEPANPSRLSFGERARLRHQCASTCGLDWCRGHHDGNPTVEKADWPAAYPPPECTMGLRACSPSRSGLINTIQTCTCNDQRPRQLPEQFSQRLRGGTASISTVIASIASRAPEFCLVQFSVNQINRWCPCPILSRLALEPA
jgi:hypothetical protein